MTSQNVFLILSITYKGPKIIAEIEEPSQTLGN
jgi:hypothetical protein